MEGMAIVGVLALMLAGVNGANDVSRGVATLAGSGAASPQRAILWATMWTVIGGGAALWWGSTLVKSFGTELVTPEFAPGWTYAASVLGGATVWVALASWRGWPVSTTHALLGALVGSVLMDNGVGGLSVTAVAYKAVLPLLLSPFLAIALCALFLLIARIVAARIPPWRPGCCPPAQWRRNPFVCASAGQGATPPAAMRQLWSALHWSSSGAISFARALNDVPKIAAFVGVAAIISPGVAPLYESATVMMAAILTVTLAMAIGGVWGGYRVLQLLAHRVATIEPATGLVANWGTSLLVFSATPLGLPVSTTHVSAGSLLGVRWLGRARPEVDALTSMLVAWLVTIPAAGFAGAVITFLFNALES